MIRIEKIKQVFNFLDVRKADLENATLRPDMRYRLLVEIQQVEQTIIELCQNCMQSEAQLKKQ